MDSSTTTSTRSTTRSSLSTGDLSEVADTAHAPRHGV